MDQESKNTLLKKIAENIRSIRKTRGFKLKEVSDFLGITLKSYQHYESGIRNIPIEHLIALSKLYNIEVDQLIGNPYFDDVNTAIAFTNYKLNEYGDIKKDELKWITNQDGFIKTFYLDENTVHFFLSDNVFHSDEVNLFAHNQQIIEATVVLLHNGDLVYTDKGRSHHVLKKDVKKYLPLGVFYGELKTKRRTGFFF